jgi:hypothetical protein
MGIFKPITNTERDAAHPEWCMGGNPRAIEAQEARGQKELCQSCQLPVRVLHEPRSLLEEAGVVFGEPSANDALFCDVTLPPGWKIRPTDHSMWSELVDDKGRVRASIFYKAAFYDRSAHLIPERQTQVGE